MKPKDQPVMYSPKIAPISASGHGEVDRQRDAQALELDDEHQQDQQQGHHRRAAQPAERLGAFLGFAAVAQLVARRQ